MRDVERQKTKWAASDHLMIPLYIEGCKRKCLLTRVNKFKTRRIFIIIYASQDAGGMSVQVVPV